MPTLRQAWKELRAEHPRSWIAAVVAVWVLTVLGTYGLALATNVWLALSVVGIAVLVAAKELDEVIGRLLGATLLAAVALAGFNVVLDKVVRLPILLGLIVAVFVFGAVAWWYISGSGWPRRRTGCAAGLLAVFMIIGVPWIVGASAERAPATPVERAVAASSGMDIVIVTDGAPHSLPRSIPMDDSVRGFDARFSVGVAVGDRVRWTLVGGKDPTEALRVAALGATTKTALGRPAPRPGADSALLLLVDGTAPVTAKPDELADQPEAPGALDRWRGLAESATRGAEMPVFAVLQSRDAGRLKAWKNVAKDAAAVSIQSLGSPTVVDAGVRLGVAAAQSRGDFALAVQHRPILLFDGAEPVPRPLSIETLFSEGRVRLCRDDASLRTACSDEPTTNPADLRSGPTHLGLTLRSPRELKAMAVSEQDRLRKLEAARPDIGVPPRTPPPASTLEQPLGAGSAMYVNAVSRGSMLYLDYWWYLQDNPARTGAGAFCGAGLVIPGITCHNHQSDWEGMTVVIDRAGAIPVVTSVHYAQHNKIVRYWWHTLQKEWARPKYRPFFENVSNAATRPLAFSASGTHATYPAPCGYCPQEPKGLATIGENPHGGQLGWSGNNTSSCGEGTCLKVLPARDRGHQPALWNDFAGPWGERNCKFRYYCDSGAPPAAPGQQRRFREPWRFTVDGR